MSSESAVNDDHVLYDKSSEVCVIIGHSIEAITSAVVLASLDHQVHIYADLDLLAQQVEHYGFERHLQALWQLYGQQQQIVQCALPASADKLIQRQSWPIARRTKSDALISQLLLVIFGEYQKRLDR